MTWWLRAKVECMSSCSATELLLVNLQQLVWVCRALLVWVCRAGAYGAGACAVQYQQYGGMPRMQAVSVMCHRMRLEQAATMHQTLCFDDGCCMLAPCSLMAPWHGHLTS